MMKHAKYNIGKWLPIVALTALMSLSVACGHIDEPKPEPPTPDPEPKAATRTVLVYMVATNNLGTGGFDNSDLREMQTFASSGELGDGRLLAYHASTKGIVLKEITEAGIDTLKVYDNNDPSVSVARMRQVIADVKELAPSDEYGLVLWSHATGWLQDGIEEEIPSNRYRSFGADGQSNAMKMNITSMAYALEDSGLAFIYFDCCYMGSVETLYELRDCAPYFVASATEDPADGMPYDKTLKHLFDTSITVEEAMINAAKTTFDTYNDVYVKGECPCTMAVVKSDKLEDLAKATADIYKLAEKPFNSEYEYQRFKISNTCPYFDFEQYVESICTDEQKLADWRKKLKEVVIYADATPYVWHTPLLYHCGLSTYILSTKSSTTNNNYDTLSWYDDVASYLIK